MQLRFAALAFLIGFSACAEAATAEQEQSVVSRVNSCTKSISEGDASKAIAFVEPVLKQDKKNRDALICKGRAHGIAGQNTEALAAFQAADELSTKPTDRMLLLDLMGNIHKNNKQYDAALASYGKSLAMAQAEKNAYFTRVGHNLIGDIYVLTDQLPAALESYIAGTESASNGNDRADSYERVADLYDRMKQHDKAVEYQIKAVVTEEAFGDLDHRANAGLEMGRLYTAAGNYEKSELAINKILKLAKEQGGPYWEAKSYYYLGLNKVKSSQPEVAKSLFADARKIAEEIHAQGLSEDINLAQQALLK